jgi:hypothetical protein
VTIHCPACGVEINTNLGQVAEHDTIDQSAHGDEFIASVRCKTKEKLFTIVLEEY